ncbi:hypothetical protein EH31_10315 [Erythrobacter longus]|uniref:Uncharacterized protein n=1 Tax=Erythrobacter longus TaxID=1044 RepID=A0A074MXW5_ERYLO|nr:hypothetical protein [Erythrobacter longus]KEO90472.1 hypothetical protein EH31_10315 [Erythrobacter longus]
MTDFEHVTTDAVVKTYDSAIGVFSALLREVRELSKKKPDATLSASKVKLINAVINDLLTFLISEPEGKYLHSLEDDTLPQVSDALMMMVQFDAALRGFKERYFQYTSGLGYSRANHYWITNEQLAKWDEEDAALEAEDDDEGEDNS